MQQSHYDAILFLGIKPKELYVKFVLKQNIPFDTLHNRRKNGTGSGYKCDFKEKDMVKIETLQDMQTEFDKHFSFIFKSKK